MKSNNNTTRRKKNKRFYIYTSNRYIYITIAIICSLIPTKQPVLNLQQQQQQNNNVWTLFADASTIIQEEQNTDNSNIPSSSFNNISPTSPIASRILKKVKLYTTNTNTIHTENINKLEEQKTETSKNKVVSLNQILLKAGKSGLGGGIQGAIAGVIQVLSLMWLRTIISYQYRYGTTFHQALQTLLNEGGISRLYRGLSFAIIQAPLSRFGSTAANDSVQALLQSFEATKMWGLGLETVIASVFVGIWRMLLMPIDTCKTVLQVDSYEGFRNLMRKVRIGKIGVLYQGMFAQAISAVVAHYPWFYTYNYLNSQNIIQTLIPSSLLRNASIGFFASFVSDSVTNCIRVVKTMKQTIATKHTVGYGEAISIILASDGWRGLFGRGLRTRILGNGLQSIVFTVVWRWLASRWRRDSVADINSDNNFTTTTTSLRSSSSGETSTTMEDEKEMDT